MVQCDGHYSNLGLVCAVKCAVGYQWAWASGNVSGETVARVSMRGVLAVDEAFCLISHYPRDSHAPHSHSASRPGAGRRARRGRGARGRARRGGAGAGLLDASTLPLPASNAGVGVALVGSAASRSGAGAGGGTSSVERRDPRDAPRPRASGAQRGGPPAPRRSRVSRRRDADRRPGTSCPAV